MKSVLRLFLLSFALTLPATAAAKDTGIAIVPAVCPIGYSNDLLCRDPNLIEAIPVKDMPLLVRRNLL